MSGLKLGGSLAVAYLARGADSEPLNRFRRFVASYKSHAAGVEHNLFIIFKGFQSSDDLEEAHQVFAALAYTPIHTDDENFDIGAYRRAAEQIPHDRLCFLNTNTELLCQDWLAKLAINLDQPCVGIAGATGSFESLYVLDARFPKFPNVHLRSNAFILRREKALWLLPLRVPDKRDAYLAESGRASFTRRLFDLGLSSVIVGRDGRAYPPQQWPSSQTFRQGTQSNLLVHDNVTRAFDQMPWPEKRKMTAGTWGRFLDEGVLLLQPDESGPMLPEGSQ